MTVNPTKFSLDAHDHTAAFFQFDGYDLFRLEVCANSGHPPLAKEQVQVFYNLLDAAPRMLEMMQETVAKYDDAPDDLENMDQCVRRMKGFIAEVKPPVTTSTDDIVSALRDVQEALACIRDNKPYIHPKHGTLSPEEVKYCIVDPILESLSE